MITENRETSNRLEISLLTGANDPPYVIPLAKALVKEGIFIDFIANYDMAKSDVARHPLINYLNLRGSQDETAGMRTKINRILKYYLRLIKYTIETPNKIFHIIWLNKFIHFDRIFMNLFYKMMSKKIIFTAHNINEKKRDGTDGLMNRLSLSFMYRICDHIFVHTQSGKNELKEDFKINANKVSVIPFGINDTAPVTVITAEDAKRALGLYCNSKIILFFGQIAKYKGLEYLVDAFKSLCESGNDYNLIIAGKIKRGHEEYWNRIKRDILSSEFKNKVKLDIGFIPDNLIEHYFKAADITVLPYVSIFQSGVLILSYYFGLPVITTKVGEFEEDVKDGVTGFLCNKQDGADIANKISLYFNSGLYRNLENERPKIRTYALNKYNWGTASAIISRIYRRCLAQ